MENYKLFIPSAWTAWAAQIRGLQTYNHANLAHSNFKTTHVFAERAFRFKLSGDPLNAAEQNHVLVAFRNSLSAFQTDIRAWPMHLFFKNNDLFEAPSESFQFLVPIPALDSRWRDDIYLAVSWTGARPYVATVLNHDEAVRHAKTAVRLLVDEIERERLAGHSDVVERGNILLARFREQLTVYIS